MSKELATAYLMVSKKDKIIVHAFVHTLFLLGLCDMYTAQIMNLTTTLVRSRGKQ